MRGLYHNFHLKLNGVSELCIKPWYEFRIMFKVLHNEVIDEALLKGLSCL